MSFLRPQYVVMPPKVYVQYLILMTEGITYQVRSTLEARVRYVERRARVRGETYQWPGDIAGLWK